MNKITIIDNKVINYDKHNHLFINDYSKGLSLNISKDTIFIYVNADMELYLECEYNKKDEDVVILVDANTNLKLFEYKIGLNIKGNIKFMVLDNAKLIVDKFCHINKTDETIDILLNGINAKVEYHFATISNDYKLYTINVHHHNKQTNSNIINHGISLDGSTLKLDINGYIGKGNSESVINQINKLIVLGDNKSVINPKLYIDENNVEAKHAAVIGRFNNRDLFYFKSRGIEEETAIKLMAKGFLLGILDIPNNKKYDILKNINAHWE